MHLTRVTIGHDSGSTVEISSGIGPNDLVILEPSDSLADGQEVHIADHSSEAQKAQAQ